MPRRVGGSLSLAATADDFGEEWDFCDALAASKSADLFEGGANDFANGLSDGDTNFFVYIVIIVVSAAVLVTGILSTTAVLWRYGTEGTLH